MAIPRIRRTTPVALFNVIALALLANRAAILAQNRVDNTQSTRINGSGIPPITK